MPVIEWIESQLDAKDRAAVEFLRSGFTGANLDAEFYEKAFRTKDGFTAPFFAEDLALRNAKAAYLNRTLGREEGMDIITIENAPQTGHAARIEQIFVGGNLLEREKAIDNFLWETADEITLMMNFKLGNILAITAKLCIIERWLALDENTGRELLGRLVTGIRGTYGEIKFEQFK